MNINFGVVMALWLGTGLFCVSIALGMHCVAGVQKCINVVVRKVGMKKETLYKKQAT